MMRSPIKENPVTTAFMAGFGIFILAAYLFVVHPVKEDRDRIVRDMCGEPVSYTDESAMSTGERPNTGTYERKILDN